MPTPWRNGLQLTHNWRCECNRIVNVKLTSCDKCGRLRKRKVVDNNKKDTK